MAHRLMRTKAFVKSCDERKRVEMRLAPVKIGHDFDGMHRRLYGQSANKRSVYNFQKH